MFEKPSTENNDTKKRKSSSKKHALLGAAMIAGVGVSDATHAKQDNITAEEWKGMYEALTPETRASIEEMRKWRKKIEPRDRVKLEWNGKIIYENGSGTIPDDPDHGTAKP